MRKGKIMNGMVIVGVFGFSLLLFGAETQPEASQSLWDIIKGGGIIGYIIILLSIVGFSLAIESMISLKRDKLIPPDLVENLQNLFEEENYEEAIELCENNPSFLGKIMSAALSKINVGYDAMIQTVTEVGEQEATYLHQKIGWLSLIGNIAPMLGLLGTVSGMIQAFNKIATSGGAAKPKDLAAGISVALITTCLGLIVAIPVMSLFAFLRNRVVRGVMEAGAITTELLERFRPEE